MGNLLHQLKELKNGKLAILFDDINTNIGYLVGLAEYVKPENVN